MPINLTKIYPELLEILHHSESIRKESLLKIYRRDIEDNTNFIFQGKRIYPIKANGQVDMERQFAHLTCKEVENRDNNGQIIKSRVFDSHRSQRLHWIKPHTEESTSSSRTYVFSTVERDQKKRKDVSRTYIYDEKEKYVIVFEPQHRNGQSYYLLTAYYLNEEYGERSLRKKLKKKLNEVL